VEIRLLSEHDTDEEMFAAEHKWLKFWSSYCDLFNLATIPGFKGRK